MHQSRHADHAATEPAALDDALLRAWQMPLDEDGDKVTRGTVLVVAGSTTTAGAALLAGTAALRMGAGRLQIATAAPVAMGLSIAVPEAMVLPLPVDDDDRLAPERSANTLQDRLAAAQAVLVGPGMDSPEAIRQILELAATTMQPEAILVVDAAAVRVIASVEPSSTAAIADRVLLTPNRQELQSLVESLGLDEQTDPLEAASASLRATISCFGDVLASDGRRWRAEATTPGLGTSGSGDVLAGLAAGAAARCADVAQAACWATYVHGSAGNQIGRAHV